MEKKALYPADIMLPCNGWEKWAVVACDQFTSEPEYWHEVEAFVGDAPSALKITLPEVYLSDNPDRRAADINRQMNEYINDGILKTHPDSMIYVERTVPGGGIRRGIVAAIDLEDYDFTAGAEPLIRATEGTVLSRIPPRVKIRRDAPLELPHVMLLTDDPERTVIEPLANIKMELAYDFELMAGGGHIKGYFIPKSEQIRINGAIKALMPSSDSPLMFAVGDGNHSLATAKTCYEENKNPLNRYALVELVNIHDTSLEFEPIYRVLFNVDTDEFITLLRNRLPSGKKNMTVIAGDNISSITYDGLAPEALTPIIDEYTASHPKSSVDYIHGEDAVRRLSSQPDTVGLIFDGMDKSELFPYVTNKGSLPRKTFSMGEAQSKRYYIECRKIKN